MTTVIARREYQLSTAEGHTSVVVSIGAPALIPDAPHGDWYCPWQAVGPDGTRELHACGVDSLQSLLLAVSMIRVTLQHDATLEGALTWLDQQHLGLDLLPDTPVD